MKILAIIGIILIIDTVLNIILKKVRVSYILSNAVAFARHPAAFGKGGNVPSVITAL